jgi:hypothetical protein
VALSDFRNLMVLMVVVQSGSRIQKVVEEQFGWWYCHILELVVELAELEERRFGYHILEWMAVGQSGFRIQKEWTVAGLFDWWCYRIQVWWAVG